MYWGIILDCSLNTTIYFSGSEKLCFLNRITIKIFEEIYKYFRLQSIYCWNALTGRFCLFLIKGNTYIVGSSIMNARSMLPYSRICWRDIMLIYQGSLNRHIVHICNASSSHILETFWNLHGIFSHDKMK